MKPEHAESAKRAIAETLTLPMEGDIPAMSKDLSIILIADPYNTQNLSLTLVTNNLKEFERVEGLRLDNWV